MCREVWGFESPPGHQELEAAHLRPFVLVVWSGDENEVRRSDLKGAEMGNAKHWDEVLSEAHQSPPGHQER